MSQRYFLDENISRKTAEFLRVLGYDVETATDAGLQGVSDNEIAVYAARKKRTLITLDLDFGELFWTGSPKASGVIVLRVSDQTIESLNRILERLLASDLFTKPEARNALVVVDENKVRVRLRP